MRVRHFVLLLILSAVLVPAGANASTLIDRNATGITLKVNASGQALLSYNARGKRWNVLAWDAVNAIPPTPGKRQVDFKLDYSGGWGTYKKDVWKTLVNTCGPWADAVNARDGMRTRHRHVLSKGVHLIVERITPNPRVLTFFADDGRLFFVIPMGPRTCIGTTDTPVSAPEVGVTPEDRRFVLDNINRRLRLARPLEERDVVAERCGVRPLVVAAGSDETPDWMQLSRKHAIETDEAARHVTVFGGKLTDCLNVGEELCAEAIRLGVALPFADRRWWGEPPDALGERFFHEARLAGLDALPWPAPAEPRSARLWRRYGVAALELLETVRRDPRQAEVIVPGTDFMRCELEAVSRREMVVKLEDFLRRRTAIAQVVRADELRHAPGVREACEALFGDEADGRWSELFGGAPRASPTERMVP